MSTPLDGYKTYITTALGIGAVVFFWYQGDVAGASALPMILGFLGLSTVKHAVARNGNGS